MTPEDYAHLKGKWTFSKHKYVWGNLPPDEYWEKGHKNPDWVSNSYHYWHYEDGIVVKTNHYMSMGASVGPTILDGYIY